ncbi:putative pentatricopeptide repeat-containing protein At1g10330 [Humulus lupulus]|uniref:putative pentatricopeptide repeat-containing protein At1g10330 n=1 Tax=Humulus lupulus TaxID=3486 RepID=UPI002B416A61|nr:putative pentatricopeptide repeat-containing protein At1g10330 [Humulus lupulus]XP_062096804.1 putative pentatricopeptide repeat-containing protein At1g10330 [Humulus lupulus]
MRYSPESLLQLLQRFPKHQNQVQQIHSLLIINGHLLLSKTNHHYNSKWKSTLLYNALIRAHLSFGQTHKSLILFTQMLSHQTQPNSHTFPSLVKAAALCSLPCMGKALHAQASKQGILQDPFVQTSFVSFYAGYGELSDACKVFGEMSEPCIVGCNAMIDAFCKNGDMDSAIFLFERMPERDVVSWTSVVNGFRINQQFNKAIQFFKKMINCSVKPNEATYVSLFSSCSTLNGWGALYLGKQIHGHVIRNEVQLSVYMGTALIDFYGKSGLLNAATNMFDQMTVKKICTWNAMISALSSNGQAIKALDLFENLKKEGLKPNCVTFVTILTACGRGKFVEYGLKLFRSMSHDFGVEPVMEHYGCVTDLLGKAGLLREATMFVKSMPFEPDASVLGALFGAYTIHGISELENEVQKELLGMQPQHSEPYINLSNINANMQKWDHAAGFRKMMLHACIQKVPAFSVIA